MKMKQLLIALTCIAILFVTPIVFAADIGVGIDADVNVVLSQDVETQGVEGELDIFTTTVGIPISVKDILFLRPFIGAAQVDLEIDEFDLGVESDTGLLFGVEAELNLYKTAGIAEPLNDIQFSLIGGYERSSLNVDELSLGSFSLVSPLNVDITYRSWELGLKASKDLGIITPYIGVVYGESDVEYEASLLGITLTETLDSKDNVGLRCGLVGEILPNVNVALNVELIDKTAIGGRVTYTF